MFFGPVLWIQHVKTAIVVPPEGKVWGTTFNLVTKLFIIDQPY